MAIAAVTKGDHQVAGEVQAQDLKPVGIPAFPAERFEQQYVVTDELFEEATVVAAKSKWLHVVRGKTGELLDARAYIAVAATDASRTVTIDIQKSTAGGAFASIMTVTISITNGTAVRTAVTGTLAAGAASLVRDDVIRAVVTVAGGAGAQAQGLTLLLIVRELPEAA